MLTTNLPTVNTEYETPQGETFTVIGRGTQGIIIEYCDGRVELVSHTQWANMSQLNLPKILH